MKTKTASLLLAVLIAAVFVCMIFANSIQTANGSVAVTEGFIE